jgi:hypothetical protein
MIGIPVVLVADFYADQRRGPKSKIEQMKWYAVKGEANPMKVYIQSNWVVCKRRCCPPEGAASQ